MAVDEAARHRGTRYFSRTSVMISSVERPTVAPRRILSMRRPSRRAPSRAFLTMGIPAHLEFDICVRQDAELPAYSECGMVTCPLRVTRMGLSKSEPYQQEEDRGL